MAWWLAVDLMHQYDESRPVHMSRVNRQKAGQILIVKPIFWGWSTTAISTLGSPLQQLCFVFNWLVISSGMPPYVSFNGVRGYLVLVFWQYHLD
jgi:hypothetical protein